MAALLFDCTVLLKACFLLGIMPISVRIPLGREAPFQRVTHFRSLLCFSQRAGHSFAQILLLRRSAYSKAERVGTLPSRIDQFGAFPLSKLLGQLGQCPSVRSQ